MRLNKWPPMHKGAILDHGVVWNILDSDTDYIAETTATVVEGTVEIVAHKVATLPPYAASTATVTWISGGEVGETAKVRIDIVSAEGRVDHRTFPLIIR